MARSTLTASTAAVVQPRPVASREKRERYLAVATYAGPALIGILIFSVGPVLYTLFLSFTNRNLFHFQDPVDFFGSSQPGHYSFVGLQNYINQFWDPQTHALN